MKAATCGSSIASWPSATGICAVLPIWQPRIPYGVLGTGWMLHADLAKAANGCVLIAAASAPIAMRWISKSNVADRSLACPYSRDHSKGDAVMLLALISALAVALGVLGASTQVPKLTAVPMVAHAILVIGLGAMASSTWGVSLVEVLTFVAVLSSSAVMYAAWIWRKIDIDGASYGELVRRELARPGYQRSVYRTMVQESSDGASI